MPQMDDANVRPVVLLDERSKIAVVGNHHSPLFERALENDNISRYPANGQGQGWPNWRTAWPWPALTWGGRGKGSARRECQKIYVS